MGAFPGLHLCLSVFLCGALVDNKPGAGGNLGAEPVGNSPEAFAAYIRDESAKYAKVIQASGAKVD